MPQLQVRIDSALSFDDPLATQEQHRLLVKFRAILDTRTTHLNPSFSKARAMGRRVDPDSERIKLLSSVDGVCRLPRGCLGDLREAAKQAGVLLAWEPAIKSNAVAKRSIAEIEAAVLARTGKPWTLRAEYQPAIVNAVLEKRQGMVVLPCGGGKTMSGIAAALASGEATLILVHTEDLLEQWVGAIRFLGGVDPRTIGGGTHDNRPFSAGEFAVGMVQSVAQNLDAYQRLLDSVGFLLVDECHRAPADLFSSVINRCQGRFRVGLSATPNRADGYGFLINALIGPTVFKLPRGAVDLIEWGYLRRPLVVPVRTGYSPSPDTAEWLICCPLCDASDRRRPRAVQTIATSLEKSAFRAGVLTCRRAGRSSVKCEHRFTGAEKVTLGKPIPAQVQSEAAVDPQRVGVICDLVSDAVEVGRRALTLTNRKDGVQAIEQAQRARGVNVRGVTSQTDDRGAIIAGLRSGRFKSMVATQLADEGLDIPSLDLLIMASAGRHDGTAQQRVGRVCRPDGADVPLVFDLVDDHGSATSQWRDRARAVVDAYGPEALPTARPVSVGVAMRIIHALAEGVDLDKIRTHLSQG